MKISSDAKRDVRSASHLTASIMAGRSGKEEIYYCPFCPEVKGSPDTAGKLYFNRAKGVGECKRCEVVVSDNSISSLSVEAKRFLDRRHVVEEVEESVIDTGWTLPVSEVPEIRRYLERRRISMRIVERFGIRAIRDPFLGVVLPARDLGGGRTNFMQIRDIRDSTRVKYRGVSNTNKELYGSDRIGDCDKAIVAEGVFSAISSVRLLPSEFAPLCTYGKAVTEVQLRIMQDLDQIREFILMYDGGYVGSIFKTARLMISKLPDRVISIGFLPYGKDPNDVDDGELSDVIENRVEVDFSRLRFVQSLYDSSRSYDHFLQRLYSDDPAT